MAQAIGRVLLVAIFLIALSRPRHAVAAAIPFGIGMMLTRVIYGQSDLWQAAYDRIYLALPLIALAAAIPERLFELRRVWRVAALAAVAAVPIAIGWPTLQARTTEEHEHRWLRARFAAQPPGCIVAHVARSGRRLVDVPDHALPGRADAAEPRTRRLERVDDLAALAAPARCLIYARTSICSSREARATCDAIERSARASGLRLEAIARTRLHAAPSYRALPYDVPRIEVVLYRVRESAAQGDDQSSTTLPD